MEELNFFLQLNYVGPKEACSLPVSSENLTLDVNNESFLINLERTDLLVVAMNQLCNNSKDRLLCLYILQQCLNEPSASVYAELVECYDNCLKLSTTDEEKIELNLLRFYIELYHTKSLQITRKETMEYIDNAVKLSGLIIEMQGVLGKRTKFQDSKTQMVLNVSRSNELRVMNHDKPVLPENIALNHDTLLEEMSLDDATTQLDLTPLEQCIILAKAVMTYEMQAKEDMLIEQVFPIVQFVLNQPTNWSITSFALLIRSRLEMSKHKTMERALLQYEQLGSQMTNPQPDITISDKIKYLPFLGLPHFPNFQLEIADYYLKFGALKSALSIYKSFNSYEKVVLCLKAMDMNNEAEIYVVDALKQTTNDRALYSRLLCYLGDCRLDHTLYLDAWEHSNHSCSLAKFKLAQYYFNHDEFSKALDCYYDGLAINPMKPQTWYVAGCCALRLERYEEAANCFKRTTNFDDNSEAWNNLATALLQINKDTEAHHALSMAIKDSTLWKVWMNYMYVSVLLNDLQEAIRAGLRVFQLITPKWNSQQKSEEPDFNIYNQLILKTINDLKKNKNEFLENRIVQLVGVMIEKSPSVSVWTVASKLFIASRDFEQAFKMIECAYRHLKDEHGVFYDENQFNLLCELGVELIRISELDSDNKELKHRGVAVGMSIIDNSKLETSELAHLKEVVHHGKEE